MLRAVARVELQVRVALDGREVVGADVVDAVDGAGLQLLQPLRGLLAPATMSVGALAGLSPQ